MRRGPRSDRPAVEATGIDARRWLTTASALALPVATLLALRLFAARAPETSTLWLREQTANVASWAVRAAGVHVTLAGGTHLLLTNHELRIDLACTAFDWLILYAVAVAVVPVAARTKRTALLIGLPAIVGLNLARLVVVALVSERAPQQFLFVHNVLLQTSMAVAVAALWTAFLWASRNDWKAGWN